LPGRKSDPPIDTRQRKYNRASRERKRAPPGDKVAFYICLGLLSMCSGYTQECSPSALVKAATTQQPDNADDLALVTLARLVVLTLS
jgi:hypothetical protein